MRDGRGAGIETVRAGAYTIPTDKPEADKTAHLNGTARMGDDPRGSVVNGDCRSWDIRNLRICDCSVFPTVGGVNPSLTIQAVAWRTADRIRALAARGEL
jgi:choline dehydrogenase-like flavoprotein